MVRSLRVANQRHTGPTAEEAKFEEAKPAVIDPFAGAGFGFPAEEPAEPAGGTGGGVAFPPAGDQPPAAAGKLRPAPGRPPLKRRSPAEAPAPKPGDDDDDDSKRILKQLVGDEEIEVFLRIDLMLFHDDIEIPQP